MAMLEQRVAQARTRLLLNRFMEHASWGIVAAAGGWTAVWIVERVFHLGVPLGLSVAAAVGVALLISALLTAFCGVRPIAAALELDRAAGLKERMSTALALVDSGDEFARATLGDAEKIAAKTVVAPHIPYHAPRAWPLSTLMLVVALGVGALLPPLNLFAATEKQQDETQRLAVEKERTALNAALTRETQKIKELAEKNDALKDLVKDAEALKLPESPGMTPEDVRREAVKQIDKLADKLAEARNADNEDTIKQLKRMLSQIDPKQSPTPNDKLAQSLSSGDFAGAKQALDEMKAAIEQAAKSDDPATKQQAAEIQKRIDSMSKQLAQAAKSQTAEKELENKAGMTPEQAKELVKQLSKMDAKQIQKELQKKLGEKGMSQEQLEKLAKKIANNQNAQKAAQKMSDALQKASQAMGKAQAQSQQGQKQGDQKGQQQSGEAEAQAAQALADAAEQLSEMEMTEQQLNDLESRLSELKDLQDGACQGQCDKPGKDGKDHVQGGKPQQGFGERDKQKMAHKMKAEKASTKLSGGKIIGQMLVSGQQVRGEATAEVQAAVNSAVRDATDAVNRDEVPRQYEKTLRTYFDKLAGLNGGAKEAPKPAEKAEAGSEDGAKSTGGGDAKKP